MDVTPPRPEQIPTRLKANGDERIDNYFWMNKRDDKKVLDYLNAENAYVKNYMADTEDLQRRLYEEMQGRIKQDDISVPNRLGQ